MGLFDWKHWLVLLAVVLVLFGGKRLRSLGADVGESIKGFRRSMDAEPQEPARTELPLRVGADHDEAQVAPLSGETAHSR